MSNMKVLYGIQTPDGTSFCAAQTPDSSVRLVFAFAGEPPVGANLPPEQACLLACELLATNLEILPGLAATMQQRPLQEIAAALLVPTAAARLLELATEGAEPQ